MTRYQPFNDLPAKQFQTLRDDIEKRGVVNPILVDEQDKTIDGHQRRKACAELGIECPRIVMDGLSEDDKLSLALALNLFRRHLSPSERMDAVQKMANLGMSQRRIAEATGVPRSTVQRDLKSGGPSGPPANVDPETGEVLDSSGSRESDGSSSDAAASGDDEKGTAAPAPSPTPNPAPRKVEGKDGKQYPASRPASTDADAGYRAASSRAMAKVRSDLLALDPERVAAVCLPDDRDAYLAFASDVSNWTLALGKALDDSKKLRSVK